MGIALLCQKQPPRCHPSTTQLLPLNGPPQRPQDCLRRLRELIPPGSARWPWLDKVRSIQQAHPDRAYIVKEPDEESTPPRTSAEGTKATGSKPSPGTPQFAEASFTDTLRHEPKALRSRICTNLFLPYTAAIFDSLQFWPDCSRTPAAVVWACESRQNSSKENINGNYPDHHPGLVATRRSSDLALQRKLGILPKRWAGIGLTNRGDTRVNRTVLTKCGPTDSEWAIIFGSLSNESRSGVWS